MSRRMLTLAILSCAFPLAACTSDADNRTAPTQAVPTQTGAACASEIAGFSGIIESDHTTGNLAERVYAKMRPELNRAEASCQAGHGAEALKILASAKVRYGYR